MPGPIIYSLVDIHPRSLPLYAHGERHIYLISSNLSAERILCLHHLVTSLLGRANGHVERTRNLIRSSHFMHITVYPREGNRQVLFFLRKMRRGFCLIEVNWI